MPYHILLQGKNEGRLDRRADGGGNQERQRVGA